MTLGKAKYLLKPSNWGLGLQQMSLRETHSTRGMVHKGSGAVPQYRLIWDPSFGGHSILEQDPNTVILFLGYHIYVLEENKVATIHQAK